MKKETIDFLKFIDEDLSNTNLKLDLWKNYIHQLPEIYNQDITFRLLFDWHWQVYYKSGRACYRSNQTSYIEPIFQKQIDLIVGMANYYDFEYQYRELILYHARVDLRGKSLLEIGGSIPSRILFDELEIDNYVNIESPDYIQTDDGHIYSENHGNHERRRTIKCNAEELTTNLTKNSFDSIFSVACFEHIYDLSTAISECHSCLREGGSLYSFFAPIYSHLTDGDHGVIPHHVNFEKELIGFHLLSTDDQRKKLINLGITNPSKIQDFLGEVNFNRIPSRKSYEDYERILTESPFFVRELERIEELNISKRYPYLTEQIRSSNYKVGNLMALGFRVLLVKD